MRPAIHLLVEPYKFDDTNLRNCGWNEIHLVPGDHLIAPARPELVTKCRMTSRRSAVLFRYRATSKFFFIYKGSLPERSSVTSS
jgi:hypothetical protein